jgi:hypothetical protein
MWTRKEKEFYLEDISDKTKCILCNKPLKNHSDKDLNDCIQKIGEAENEAESMEGAEE